MYAQVVNGAVVAHYTNLPASHWIADTPTTGHYETVTEANVAGYGYLPVVPGTRKP